MVNPDTTTFYKRNSPDPIAVEAAIFIKRAKQHIADGCVCCKEALLQDDLKEWAGPTDQARPASQTQQASTTTRGTYHDRL